MGNKTAFSILMKALYCNSEESPVKKEDLEIVLEFLKTIEIEIETLQEFNKKVLEKPEIGQELRNFLKDGEKK